MLNLICALILVIATTAGAAENERPLGQNCDLSTPPPSAGESWNHGFMERIYPRAKDISDRYNGCQVLFVSTEEGKWSVMFVIEILRGDPVRIWAADMKSDELACRYKNGALVAGDSKACSDNIGLLKSLAPGCGKAINEWLAKDPPNVSTKPAGCSAQ